MEEVRYIGDHHSPEAHRKRLLWMLWSMHMFLSMHGDGDLWRAIHLPHRRGPRILDLQLLRG
jgi:hypothetical protein